jgi:hypothetical protein
MKATTTITVLALLAAGTSPRTLPADIRPDRSGEPGEEKQLEPELQRGGPGERLVNVVKEGEDNLKEIQRLLDEVQGNLAGQETGAPTQEKQKQVVEKMTRLLEKLESECSKCSASSSSSPQKKSGGDPKEQEEQQKKQEQQEQQARQQQKSQAELQESEKERRDGKAENDRTAREEPPAAESGGLRARMLEASRRWGILPPKLREEVLFSTGKEAPREYLQIISRYYERMTKYYEDRRGE